MRDLPVVDVTTCTGCGDCVAICPTRCVEMVGLVPWLPRPGDCASCAACVLICPVSAIVLRNAFENLLQSG